MAGVPAYIKKMAGLPASIKKKKMLLTQAQVGAGMGYQPTSKKHNAADPGPGG